MKASLRPRSWTSRARLTAAIAITLAVGGTFLLVAQYALFTALLNREVEANRAQVDQALESVPGLGPEDFEVLYDGSHGPAGLSSDPVIAQALRNGLGWSALLLGVFIAVAVGWAWFLSRRSLRRISRLTSATSEITEHDLSQRLALQGPPDEITQLGDTIDSMIERLEQAFSRQERFIANASHELRTPLATVRTALQVPLRQGRVPEDLRPDLQDAIEANRRMEQLVAALLSVARGQAGADLAAEAIDLDALVRNAAEELAPEAEKRRVGLEVEASGPAELAGDPALLRSLVSNLVRNGIVHNLPEGGRCSVTVAAAGDAVELRVENTGVEHDPETIARLAEPFYRGDESRLSRNGTSDAGTGLGLTLASRIAELHRAELDLSSRPGGGLIAVVRFPVSA